MTVGGGRLTDLVRESALYGIASLAGVLATFALAPIYMRLLDPRQFGDAALVTTIGTLLSMASILSLDSAAHRLVWLDAGPAHSKTVFGTWLRVSLIVALLLCLVVVGVWFCLMATGVRLEILDLVALWSLGLPFRVAHVVRLQWARAHRRPLSAGLWALSVALLTIASGLVLVVMFETGAFGVIAGQTLATVVVGAGALMSPVLRGLTRGGIDRVVLRRMFGFSFPLLPVGLASWFLAVGDRWILGLLYGSYEVGLYQAAFTVTGVIALPLMAFNQAFSPWALSIHANTDSARLIRRAFYMMLLLSTLGSISISLLAVEIVRFVADRTFEPAADMVPFLVFATVAQATVSFTAIGCNIVERNAPIARAVFLGALTIVPVVVLLDPTLGATSVAASTLISQVVTAALVMRSAERLWPVGYGWRLPIGSVIAAGVLVFTTL